MVDIYLITYSGKNKPCLLLKKQGCASGEGVRAIKYFKQRDFIQFRFLCGTLCGTFMFC